MTPTGPIRQRFIAQISTQARNELETLEASSSALTQPNAGSPWTKNKKKTNAESPTKYSFNLSFKIVFQTKKKCYSLLS